MLVLGHHVDLHTNIVEDKFGIVRDESIYPCLLGSWAAICDNVVGLASAIVGREPI